jgi:hypothetical protein
MTADLDRDMLTGCYWRRQSLILIATGCCGCVDERVNQEEWQSFPDMAQRLSQVYTGSVLTDGRSNTNSQHIPHSLSLLTSKPLTVSRLPHWTDSD